MGHLGMNFSQSKYTCYPQETQRDSEWQQAMNLLSSGECTKMNTDSAKAGKSAENGHATVRSVPMPGSNFACVT